MKIVRSVVVGFLAAAVALATCVAITLSTVRKVEFEPGARPPTPGVVLSQAEIDARSRRAEAHLAAARSGVSRESFAGELRAEISEAFAYLGPLVVTGSVLLLAGARAGEALVVSLPVLGAMLLLGPRLVGLLLLPFAAIGAHLLRRFVTSGNQHRGDA